MSMIDGHPVGPQADLLMQQYRAALDRITELDAENERLTREGYEYAERFRRQRVALETRIAELEAMWANVCSETGYKVEGGTCPEHGGDSCLVINRVYTLTQRITELEAALQFYADDTNWTQPTSYGGRLYDADAPASRDCGVVARRALGGE